MACLSENDGDSSTGQKCFLNNYLKEYAQSEQVDVGQVLGWLLLNVCVFISGTVPHSFQYGWVTSSLTL